MKSLHSIRSWKVPQETHDQLGIKTVSRGGLFASTVDAIYDSLDFHSTGGVSLRIEKDLCIFDIVQMSLS